MAEKNKVKDEQGEDETTSSNGGDYSWGTLEELLLACAVNRHGSNSWDSIADELQKRVKLAVSPSDCHQKYLHLKRRFHFDEDDGELLRVVDELRKLRVEELKHEVQRHDVSIVSLKMKVKRLEEEREKSLSKVEEPEKETDLRTEPDENGRKNGEKPDGSSPEKVITGDSAENRSFNESNSTNHNKKGDKPAVIDERELKSKREPEEMSNEPDPVRYRSKDEPGKDRTSRPGESVSESKRESVKQQQQSSDVQSSASLSKKKRRRFRGLGGGGGGGSSGDEAEEISPANKRISVKSQPLIRFFEILQSHKHGSVFQRRLPSQETEKYRNIVRQHMDLDTVQSKLEKGNYSECHPKFYRDILLIFTNAVLFYRKSSAEHIAARELRKVVIEEIAHRASKPNKAQIIKPDGELQHLEPVLVKKPRSSTTMVVCRRRSSSSMQALSETIKSRSDPNHASSNNNNNNNISKKGGDDENNNNNNKNNNDSTNSSNVVVSRKEEENEKNGGGGGGDEGVVVNGKKVVTKERSSLGRVGLRLSNSSNSTSKKKMIDNSNKESNNNREKVVKKPGNKKEESGEGEVGETMNRKKMANGDEKQEKGTTTLKKQGVANFLKRMKQNSPSQLKDDHESEEEEDLKVKREKEEKKREKTSNNDNNNGKKRNGNVKRNRGDNEGVVTRGGNEGRRGEREVDGGSRRATGRPPKRKAALMSSSGRSSNTTDSGKGGGRSVFVGRDSGEKSKKKPRR